MRIGANTTTASQSLRVIPSLRRRKMMQRMTHTSRLPPPSPLKHLQMDLCRAATHRHTAPIVDRSVFYVTPVNGNECRKPQRRFYLRLSHMIENVQRSQFTELINNRLFWFHRIAVRHMHVLLNFSYYSWTRTKIHVNYNASVFFLFARDLWGWSRNI